jgi:hypothetical protein
VSLARTGQPELRRRSATAFVLTTLVLVPANARAQTTTQVVEFYDTDAIRSVRAVTKTVNGVWPFDLFDPWTLRATLSERL